MRRILLTALALETLCATYALQLPSITPVTSILYSLAGLAIAACLLYMPADNKLQAPLHGQFRGYLLLLWIASLLVMRRFATVFFQDNPLDFHVADMLPIIRVMCERFLAGAWAHVYDPIPEIWHGTVPIYLPAMWLPFTLPVSLGIDPRWLTVAIFALLLGIFLRITDPRKRKVWVLYACCFILLWWLFENDTAGLVAFTEEGVVILYYVLLALALTTERVWLIALCAALCALSRYALAGWLPSMIIYFIWLKQWKQLLWFSATGIASFMVLLILPFGFHTIGAILSLPDAYIGFTARVWKDSPHVFSESLGFARFFGPERIVQQHYLLETLSLAIPPLVMVLFLLMRKKWNISGRNIPLAVLKITLVIFYSLVDVPYLYLFYTPVFVSLFAAVIYVRRERASRSN